MVEDEYCTVEAGSDAFDMVATARQDVGRGVALLMREEAVVS